MLSTLKEHYFKQNILFTVKRFTFSSKAKMFLVSNSKSCCSTFKGKRKTKQ